MSSKTQAIAQRLIDIIDKRVLRNTGSMARVETTWGKVAARDTSAGTVDVYLYNSGTASQGFRITGGAVPAVNSYVKVAIDRRGDRWVMEPILAAGSTGGGGSTGDIIVEKDGVVSVAAAGVVDFDHGLAVSPSGGTAHVSVDEATLVITVLPTTLALTSDITPAQLVANTDDWNPTSLSSALVIRASTDASRNLTGLAGGFHGREIYLQNVGAFDLVLKHDVTSTAANRFLLPDNADLTLKRNSYVILLYDATSSRWRANGGGGSGGGSIAGKEDNSVVVATATALNVAHGLDMADGGSGRMDVSVDESEFTYGASGDIAAETPTSTVLAGAIGKPADAGHRHPNSGFAATGDIPTSTAGPDADITIDAAGASGTASTFARHLHGHKLTTYASTPAANSGAGSAGASGDAPSRGTHAHPTTGLELTAHKDQVSGYPSLDSSGLIPASELPHADGEIQIEIIDKLGSVLTTGVKVDVHLPFGGTWLGWTVLADVSGSIQFDLWKITRTSFPPTVTNTITASDKPKLTTAIQAQGSSLTGWTTTFSADDTLRINVDSVTTVTRVVLALKYRRTS